jgi:flavin reductase (DIM6/NTAB) family NADH-FMN oxidoreductase RutF
MTRAMRDAFGQFATGVTLVTTRWNGLPVGMVANSFSSVSLEPPLVLWCPARSARRFPAFAEADRFAIHVLAQDQGDLVMRFLRAEQGFDATGFDDNGQDPPLLVDCLARFECQTWARHDGGDHLIQVGRVLRASLMRDGDPMVFQQGRYGTLVR